MTHRETSKAYNSLFPTRLKLLLTESNTSQQELGSVLGVQRQTVNMYVNGQIRPDIDALAIIAQHFDVTTDWLLGLTNDRRRNPIATDELGLSEEAITKLKNYCEKTPLGGIHWGSSIDAVLSHVDFEELLEVLDNALYKCSEVIAAYSSGETEFDGEKAAINAFDYLENTRWTVITSAKYAEYLVYSAQQLFNQIVADISNVKAVHDIMEY